jgi:hypothetical protein
LSRFIRNPTADALARRMLPRMDPSQINWLAVVVATVLAFVLGGAWYGPVFGKVWQRHMGLSDEVLKQHVPRTFAVAIVLAFVSATNLAFFLGPTATLGFGVGAGAATGIGFVATALGVTYAFGRRPLTLALIDAGYHALSFTMMGALLGAWR